MEYITNHAEFLKRIASIKNRGALLDKDIQDVALSAIKAVLDNGNIFYVNHLYTNMPKGSRVVALTAWMLAFGGVIANLGKDKASKPFVVSKDKKVDLASAEAKPWFNFKPSPTPDMEFDVYKALMKVLAGTEKDKVEVKHGVLIEGIRALVATIDPDAPDAAAAAGDTGTDASNDADVLGTITEVPVAA